MTTANELESHQAAMLTAFTKVLAAEETLRAREVELRDTTHLLELKKAEAETALAEAWRGIETLMAETGEYEVVLPGAAMDYKIGRGPSRGSVKVVDLLAVPDEFVKVERKPKLKEIGEHLKRLPVSARPNWASLERSEGKLGWRAVKKVGAA